MWPGDALAVIATSDADVAVRVGDDLGFYVQPQEITPIEDAARPIVAEGRPADAYDVIADGLVSAFDAPPPDAGATPTPRPSPTPETVRTPDFVGLTRTDAQTLADENGLRLRVDLPADRLRTPGHGHRPGSARRSAGRHRWPGDHHGGQPAGPGVRPGCHRPSRG